MQSITLEIILRAVFGVRDATRLRELRAALVDLLAFITDPKAFAVVAVLGAERATRLSAFTRVMEPADRLLREEIRAHREADDLEERDDILSLLLLARHEDGSPMSDDELRDELMTLLVAGHETTATGLSWAFERLLRTPDALGRLREEVAAGESEYSLAVGYETLRLRPVLPLVLRRLAEPMEIAGHQLPAGVKAAPSIVMIHRRPDIYPDPHAFRPERFVGVKPGTYTWIPFGGGVRRCLGAAFALYEMQIVLEAVARSADLRAVDSRPERVTRRAITFAPKRGTVVVRQPGEPTPAAEGAAAPEPVAA
jgi:cytochrome P450